MQLIPSRMPLVIRDSTKCTTPDRCAHTVAANFSDYALPSRQRLKYTSIYRNEDTDAETNFEKCPVQNMSVFWTFLIFHFLTPFNLDLQRDALEKAGCEKIYTDQQSGTNADRLSLAGALKIARSGYTLMVWRLDRLGSSLKHLIHLVEILEQQGIGLRRLQENMDATPVAAAWCFTCSALWLSPNVT